MMNPGKRLRWSTLCVAAACVGFLAASVQAELQHTMMMPQMPPPVGSKVKTSQLRLGVAYHGVEGNGYAPIKLSLTTFVPVGPVMTSPPSTVARTLKVRITARIQKDWGLNMSEVTTESEIVLPAGAVTSTTDVLMPLHGRVYMYDLFVTEGNRVIPELSGPAYVGSNNYSSEGDPRYLFLDADCPIYNDRLNIAMAGGTTQQKEYQNRKLLPMFPVALAEPSNRAATVWFNGQQSPLYRYPDNDAAVLSELMKLSNAAMTSPDLLYDDWLSYSRYDYIYMGKDELVSLRTTYPKSLAAMRDWVRTGGRLVVYDLTFADDLEMLERTLALAPRGEGLSRGWEFPYDVSQNHPDLQGEPSSSEPAGTNSTDSVARLLAFREEIRDLLASPSREERQKAFDRVRRLGQPVIRKRADPPKPPVRQPGMPADPLTSPQAPPTVDPNQTLSDRFPGDVPGPGRIWYHKLGFGYVVAAAHPQIDRDFERTGDAIRKFAGRCDFVTKNGLAMDGRNKDFWNFLIPGVGQQPVYAFVAMITMFIMVIGPINYFGLMRAKRLSLLLFTVPIGAGLLTLGLFLYAATADGFGVKARIRSFTMIDQRTNEVVSAARHSYYAGLSPANGLTFDDQTSVYPIDYEPTQQTTRREVLWKEGGVQNLRRGWMPSRALRQVFAVRPGTTTAKLEVTERGPKLEAKNRLGTRLKYVIVSNSAGEMFVAENVEPGGKLDLQPIVLADARPALSKFVEDNRAKFPENYDPDSHESMWFSRSSRYRNYYPWNATQEAVAFSGTSVLEEAIQEATLRSSGFSRIAPRSYVAIVDAPPSAKKENGDSEPALVPYGVTRMREFGSFHVVKGIW